MHKDVFLETETRTTESKRYDRDVCTDQASTLRRKFGSKGARVKDLTRVMSITSGKGGVGKTATVVNLGLALGGLGRSVLLLDADLGLANIDVMLGVTPQGTILDVVRGERSLSEVMIHSSSGLSIIPASSGVDVLSTLTPMEQTRLLAEIEQVAESFDYLLIDTKAGIDSDVMYFTSASNEVVIVINAEPTSLTDAYALIKLLTSTYGERSFSVVSNNVASELEGRKAFEILARAVSRHLHGSLHYLGSIPRDELMRDAIRQQRALLEVYPTSAAGRAIAQLARRLDESGPDITVKGGMQFFFRQLLEMQSYGS